MQSEAKGNASGEPFTLPPEELVAKRHTLTAHEAAYCLNTTTRKVYDMVAMSKLAALKTKPVRVKSEEVAALMGVTRPAPRPTTEAGNDPFTLTPEEMVARRHTITAKEAAYCLNVSVRKVYEWIEDGHLASLKLKPVRIRAEDVEAMMNDFDE